MTLQHDRISGYVKSDRKAIQPKLKVGQVGDKYEQEADNVADRIMRMGENESLQMQPIEEEEEMMQPKLRMQPEEEEEPIQMKPLSDKPEIELSAEKSIQREVQLRPPGRGEASAFDRVGEMIDRLNAVSGGLEFRLDGQVLRYNVLDEAAQTSFDRQIRAFIDRAEIVPMRLITGAGYVGGGPLLVDSLQLGYVDLEDLLGSDDLGFQSNIIHILTERFAVNDYTRRLGTAGVGAEWARAHPRGLQGEAQFFQGVYQDPSIRFSWDRTSPNGNYIAVFRSRDNGFRVMLRIRGGRGEIRGTQITVRTRDGRTVSGDAFQAEREAALAASAP